MSTFTATIAPESTPISIPHQLGARRHKPDRVLETQNTGHTQRRYLPKAVANDGCNLGLKTTSELRNLLKEREVYF